MLSRVFRAQWIHPDKGDWVNQVRQDLSDFKIVCDLDSIKSMSAKGFKHMVRKKAFTYEFNQLMAMKEKKSKMKHLKYQKLEPQTYLEKFVANEAINIFKFRVKMAKFDANFHGQQPIKSCPLCFEHEDTQELSFQCKVIKSKLKHESEYEEIFQKDIPQKLGLLLTDILRIREETNNCL